LPEGNNVLLVKIEGSVWYYTIYHQRNLLLTGCLQTPLFSSTNQWEKDIARGYITAAWWYTYPSEKYEFASWDEEIPN